MSRLLLLFAIYPLSLFSQGKTEKSQLEEIHTYQKILGKVDHVGPYATLTEHCEGGDTAFALMYRNGQYTQLVEFTTLDLKNWQTVMDLYSALKNGLTLKKGDSKEFLLAGNYMKVTNIRSMGNKWVQLYVTDHGDCTLNGRELDRLFNVH